MIGPTQSKPTDVLLADRPLPAQTRDASEVGTTFSQQLDQKFAQGRVNNPHKNQAPEPAARVKNKVDATANKVQDKFRNTVEAHRKTTEQGSSSAVAESATSLNNPVEAHLPPGNSLPLTNQPFVPPGFELTHVSNALETSEPAAADDAVFAPSPMAQAVLQSLAAHEAERPVQATQKPSGEMPQPGTVPASGTVPVLGRTPLETVLGPGGLPAQPAKESPTQLPDALKPGVAGQAGGNPQTQVDTMIAERLRSSSRGERPVVTGLDIQDMVKDAKPEAGAAPQAAKGLLTALDHMPDRVSQKLEGVSPFSTLSNSAAQALEGEQTPELRMDRPLTHVRWSQDLGERVQWMVNRAMNGAEIRLNPPQLGPVEVRIQMQNDQANVSFAAHHAHVRDAIEAAIPKLREMLGQQAVNLVNVDISQHSFAEQRHQGGAAGGDGETSLWGGDTPAEPDEPVIDMVAAPTYDGLINTYA